VYAVSESRYKDMTLAFRNNTFLYDKVPLFLCKIWMTERRGWWRELSH